MQLRTCSSLFFYFNPCSYARVEMFEVPITAQQCVVDALKGSHEIKQAIVLCHTPSELVADESFSLGTHDLFDDFLGKDSISLISVFPILEQSDKHSRIRRKNLLRLIVLLLVIIPAIL